MALEYNDLIKQNLDTGKYHLGIKLFTLGHQAVSQLNLREICRPFLTRIMNETKETVHLAVLDEDRVLFLDKVEGPHALNAGDIIMPGALCGAADVGAGDLLQASFDGLGTVSVRFA